MIRPIHGSNHLLLRAFCLLYRAARSEQWAVRALGLPNFAFILSMAASLVWLAFQYEEHDEHWFVFNLQVACASGLLYISYFLFSFTTNALVTVRHHLSMDPFFRIFILARPHTTRKMPL